MHKNPLPLHVVLYCSRGPYDERTITLLGVIITLV
jgi:hypothetical protein